MKNSFPRCGEVWYGYVEENNHSVNRHEYIGRHPYLITSNNKFNDKSGMVNVIPFTSKRFKKPSPSHVNFMAGEINGLPVNSTLMCENETSIPVSSCINKIGELSDEQLEMVACSVMLQKPIMARACKSGVQDSKMYQMLINY